MTPTEVLDQLWQAHQPEGNVVRCAHMTTRQTCELTRSATGHDVTWKLTVTLICAECGVRFLFGGNSYQAVLPVVPEELTLPP